MLQHENPEPLAWQEHQTNLLAEELRSVLSLLADKGDLYELLKEPLLSKRRGLAQEAAHDVPWHLLPLTVCQSICGDFERALPIAAAFQLMLGAGDVFDDIEDADSPESLFAKYGYAISTNAATTLMILAERAISRLKERGVEDSTITRSCERFNAYYSLACRGQHMDLSIPRNSLVTEDIYLEILSMKSASQIECACHIGAMVAKANNSIIEAYSNFGHNLGMAAQIGNDILGINSGKDIARRKITLPAIYALTNANEKTRTELEGVYINKCEETPDIESIKGLLVDSGAIYYVTVKQELYKQKAADALSEVASTGIETDRMKLFFM